MSQACTISIAGNTAVLKHNGLCAGFPWSACEAVYKAVKRLHRLSAKYAKTKDHTLAAVAEREVINKQLTIHRQGLEFTFELQGRIWFQCPYTTARQIAKALLAKGRELEEQAKALQIIADEAILLRTGLPIGLSYNPQINRAAWKAAEDVHFPGAKIPEAIFYPPTIIQHPPVTVSQEG